MHESNQTSSHKPAYHSNAWALGPSPTSPSGWWNVLQKLTLSLLLMLQLGIRLPDTSSNGWAVSYLSLVAVTDPIHLPRLIKCHECPFLNYLKLLTSPNLFIWHLSPSLRGTRQRCFQTLLQKCPSDFNTKLMLCINWMFSMLTFKEKHRK